MDRIRTVVRLLPHLLLAPLQLRPAPRSVVMTTQSFSPVFGKGSIASTCIDVGWKEAGEERERERGELRHCLRVDDLRTRRWKEEGLLFVTALP